MSAGLDQNDDEKSTETTIPQSAVVESRTTEEEEAEVKPNATREHILACSFERWYPLFARSLNKPQHTMSSVMIPLSTDFVNYLVDDDTLIPDQYLPDRIACEEWSDAEEEEWIENETPVNTTNSETTPPEPEPASTEQNDSSAFFPTLMESIQTAIDRMGGMVYPQLNWRSPKDATWISCDKSLKCRSINDLLLLLKNSDDAMSQLSQPFADANISTSPSDSIDAVPPFQPYLVLRRWSNFQSSHHFRCFVNSRTLIAACQKEATYFPHLQDEIYQEQLKEIIGNFIYDVILPSFTESTFITDLYIDRDNRCWLVSIKPWSASTDAILYEWKELNEMSTKSTSAATTENSSQDTLSGDIDDFDLRLIKSRQEGEMSTVHSARTITARLPVDGIDLSDAASIEAFVDRVRALELDARES